MLDVSLTQARPRFFGWIGGSGLEIGVLGDALMASHDVNVAVSSGAATLLERQTCAGSASSSASRRPPTA